MVFFTLDTGMMFWFGCQGNAANQLVVFDNKVCDYINHILRGAQFQGCSQKEVCSPGISCIYNAITSEGHAYHLQYMTNCVNKSF